MGKNINAEFGVVQKLPKRIVIASKNARPVGTGTSSQHLRLERSQREDPYMQSFKGRNTWATASDGTVRRLWRSARGEYSFFKKKEAALVNTATFQLRLGA